MTYQELVTEIERLPLAEQLSLMETLIRFVGRRATDSMDADGSLQRVRGMLNPGPDKDFSDATVPVFSPAEMLAKLPSSSVD